MRFPLHLDLTGRRVLVVGGGPVGLRRARALHDAGALVHVVAPVIAEGMPGTLHHRPFADADVDGAWLVVTATGAVDAHVLALCEERGTWCVRADDAGGSPAWVPAVARVDEVVFSVTAGRDPLRARALRDAVQQQIDLGGLPLRRHRRGTGRVALVGGGPGDPGLLTVRARQLLAGADVVVRDRLAPHMALPLDIEVIEVGKTPGGPSWSQRDIEALLVEKALAGNRVVRLKGGDVHVFARGIEEVGACLDAGLAVEVVPGVSSALSVPALAGIPVTAHGLTQSFTVVSAHLAPGAPGSTVDWGALARLGGTLVLLMSTARLPAVCAALIAGGRAAETPLAVVRDGSLATEEVLTATLGTVSSLAVKPPAVVVIGEVVAARRVHAS